MISSINSEFYTCTYTYIVVSTISVVLEKVPDLSAMDTIGVTVVIKYVVVIALARPPAASSILAPDTEGYIGLV